MATMVEVRDKMKVNAEVTTDQEYYFAAGQLFKYFSYVGKRNVYIKQAANCKSDKIFKRCLLTYYRHFKFPNTEKGRIFKKLLEDVMNYTPETVTGMLKDEYFVNGCIQKSIV